MLFFICMLRGPEEILWDITTYFAWHICFNPLLKAWVVIYSKIELWQNHSLPTCGCRQGDGCALPVTPLCSQRDGVALSRSQVGQDVVSRCGWDLLLLNLAVFGDVRQPVGADLGPRFLPPQGEGVLCGLDFFKISGRIDVWRERKSVKLTDGTFRTLSFTSVACSTQIINHFFPISLISSPNLYQQKWPSVYLWRGVKNDCLDSCSAGSLTSCCICSSREALSLILHGSHTNPILCPWP